MLCVGGVKQQFNFMSKGLKPAAVPSRDNKTIATPGSSLSGQTQGGASNSNIESNMVMVICFKEQVVPGLQKGQSTALQFITESFGFLVQGEPGCLYTAASNILSVKEALQRAGRGGTTFQTRAIFVITLPRYQDLLDATYSLQMPISQQNLEQSGARKVASLQTEVQDPNQLLQELRSLGSHPASKDGMAALSFKGNLEGAGPGFRMATETMKSYPRSG
jgi:hypothetical protein